MGFGCAPSPPLQTQTHRRHPLTGCQVPQFSSATSGTRSRQVGQRLTWTKQNRDDSPRTTRASVFRFQRKPSGGECAVSAMFLNRGKPQSFEHLEPSHSSFVREKVRAHATVENEIFISPSTPSLVCKSTSSRSLVSKLNMTSESTAHQMRATGHGIRVFQHSRRKQVHSRQ